jgi:hypothetical protein
VTASTIRAFSGNQRRKVGKIKVDRIEQHFMRVVMVIAETPRFQAVHAGPCMLVSICDTG